MAELIPRQLFLFCLTLTMLFGLPGHARGADVMGQVVASFGTVTISNSARGTQVLVPGTRVEAGTVIKTGRLSGVSLQLEDESMIRLAQNSQLEVIQVRTSSFWGSTAGLAENLSDSVRSVYRLLSGKLWGRNNNRDTDIEINTLTATFGIRGTEFVIEADESSSSITIQEGAVSVTNKVGERVIHSGESAVVRRGEAPVVTTTPSADRVVQWTVPVAELLDIPRLVKGGIDNKRVAADVYDAYRQRNYARALDLVRAEREKQPDDLDLAVIDSWILLRAGESVTAFEQLEKLHAQSAEPYAPLHEMTALAAWINGDLERAGRILAELRRRQILSDTGWLVQGYLYRERFKLADAQSAFLTALEINPDNLPAAIESIKISLGEGQHRQARERVEALLRLRPDRPSALILDAYLLLFDNQTAPAIAAWQRALTGDASDAEAHFGLSLGYMRLGRVEDALKHIATAVLLDPQRSLYLSYWGKMLHEVGRHDKALVVLDSAARVDRIDPTPLLYKALVLRDLNRPVEALRSYQAALALNGGKLAYRSSSLLDRDEVVANFDLSLLYSELGLAAQARKTALDSLVDEPGNAAALRLYNGAGDNHRQRTNSELLALLLQPNNINSFSRFNDYTHMHEATGQQHDLTVAVGNRDQYGLDYAVNAALAERQMALGLSIGHRHSDGWRKHSGEEAQSVAAVAKWRSDPDSNWLLRLSLDDDLAEGDALTRFQVDAAIEPDTLFESDRQRFELGLHHRINHQHDLLAHVAHTATDGRDRDRIVDEIQTDVDGNLLSSRQQSIESRFEQPGSLIQMQGRWRYQSHRMLYGLLLFEGERAAHTAFDFSLVDADQQLIDDLPGLDRQTDFDVDLSVRSFYLADQWTLQPGLNLDFAIALDDISSGEASTGLEWEQRELSGRAGVAWDFMQHHTLRIASYRYLDPFSLPRLDLVHVAGVPLRSATQADGLVQASELVWAFESDAGLLTAGLTTIDESSIVARSDGSSVSAVTSHSNRDLVSLGFSTLLDSATGVELAIAHHDVKIELEPGLDRSEITASARLVHILDIRTRIALEYLLRYMSFDSVPGNETVQITNLGVDYRFADKSRELQFRVVNLFGERFNWIDDSVIADPVPPERMLTLKFRYSF